ncbi:hypothetical protein COL516b_004889 [Colletotrichum fioriniae]|nr:uncharacterized protein COL516b_004889 [Colletotrichum fioriniae]KAJ0305781.1 hypothetical protein COL516b_004889 [Colletotrichum fioriniae]
MGDMANDIKLLKGSSHGELSEKVAQRYDPLWYRGMYKKKRSLTVRDEDVFIVQSSEPGNINDGLMELLIMIHACRTASARRITAVIRQSTQLRLRKIYKDVAVLRRTAR